MPALNANVLAYINRVIALIEDQNLTTDIDVSCGLTKDFAASDTVIYIDAQTASRLVPGVATLRGASGNNNVTISIVDAKVGRVRLSATTANAYTIGERLTQTFAQTGRNLHAVQPDTISVKDVANCLQMMTDATDQGTLTCTGGSTTTVVNANTLVDVDTGLTALVGATVTMVTFAAGVAGETSTVIDCPDANTLTVFPAFSGIVAAGDTYTVTMDQIDDQITEMMADIPHQTVSPDAPGKNPAQFWATCATAIAHFNDQLATGMAVGGTGVVLSTANMDWLRGLLREYTTLEVSRAATAGDALLFVNDGSLLDPAGDTIEVGYGTANVENVVYTAISRVDQPGRWVEGAGAIQIGSRTQGGEAVITVPATLANNHAQGEQINRTSDHPTHPAFPNADELKGVLGTILTQLRDNVTAYVIPT